MLINIVGNFTFEQRGDALFIGTEESAALICNGHARLAPPEPTFQRFSAPGVTARVHYADGPPTIVRHGDKEWHLHDVLKGGSDAYGVASPRNERILIVHDWDGNRLASLPQRLGPMHFGRAAIVLTDTYTYPQSEYTEIYRPDGELLARYTLQRHGAGRQELAHFTDALAFLRTGNDPSTYQLFDLHSLQACGVLPVAGAILGVCALPDGSNLWVDAEGMHRLAPQGQDQPPQTLHRFAEPLDVEQAKLLLWHDAQRVYAAIDQDRDRQTLIALPLEGAGTAVQELHWSDTWAIAFQGGFLAGQNYLQLKRKTLLADNAVVLWRPGDVLSPALLQTDASPVVEVSQTRSAARGKHGYRLRVEDPCPNRAIRCAALELGRLLGDTCEGAYQQGDEVPDRKFDGCLSIDIATASAPTAFEQAFLPAYLAYYRDTGDLSPAGSRARLAPLAITWTTDEALYKK
ncbi:MAG: hypothetical protein J7556_14225 [Acidovorax sp.]|nr:hypothetical protein [Acidovorax sp.]